MVGRRVILLGVDVTNGGQADLLAGSGADLPARVRASTASVVDSARFVAVDPAGIDRFADILVGEGDAPASPMVDPPADDPWSVPRAGTDDGDEATVALVLTLAAINFGSGWHPVVTKRPGLSGATSMAARWRDHVGSGVDQLRPAALRGLSAEDGCRIFEQEPGTEGADLAARFVVALRELAALVDAEHHGSFLALALAADGSAARLAGSLFGLPSFADQASYPVRAGAGDGPLTVWFGKRAQLAAADVHRAFPGRAPGAFSDLGELTAFADNLVPHVLRVEGVLRYDGALLDRIDRGELLDPGSVEEVEIRAAGVHAVELLVAALTERQRPTTAADLDARLWRRGGAPRFKAQPRHRTRSPYY